MAPQAASAEVHLPAALIAGVRAGVQSPALVNKAWEPAGILSLNYLK
jgi:predicted ABC-type sugar transport system permease subunit